MLLVTIALGGQTYRVSNEELALAHNWRHYILSMDAIHFALPMQYGGYCAINYGRIELSPDLFDHAEVWPPPVNMQITVQYTATDEESAETFFLGTAHIAEMTRDGIQYELYPPEYDETTASGTELAGSLNQVLGTLLTGIEEITAIDTTLARAPSPGISYTTTSECLNINLASQIAAFCGHLFYVDGDVAVVVDMLADNGARTLTEFDFFGDDPPRYWQDPPTAIVRAGDEDALSAYPYGGEISVQAYTDVGADIQDAIDDILAIVNRMRGSITLPLLGSLPKPGERLTWTDTALIESTDFRIWARVIRFDFDAEAITIEGDGGYA